jgi:hypothetical protein
MSCGYIINQLACTAVDAGWELFNEINHPELPPTNNLVTIDENNCYWYLQSDETSLPSSIVYRLTPITEKCKYTFSLTNLFEYAEVISGQIAGTIQILGYNGTVTDANDYDILATYDIPNLNNELNTVTFSFTPEQSYDGFAFNIINSQNGILSIFDFQLEQYCCDDTTNETSNQYLITQDQVDAAIEKAKCCYGSLKSEQLQRLKDGLEVCEETNKNLLLLDMSIFVLSRYCKGGCNCIGDNDAYYKIEVINNICGCANC